MKDTIQKLVCSCFKATTGEFPGTYSRFSLFLLTDWTEKCASIRTSQRASDQHDGAAFAPWRLNSLAQILQMRDTQAGQASRQPLTAAALTKSPTFGQEKPAGILLSGMLNKLISTFK